MIIPRTLAIINESALRLVLLLLGWLTILLRCRKRDGVKPSASGWHCLTILEMMIMMESLEKTTGKSQWCIFISLSRKIRVSWLHHNEELIAKGNQRGRRRAQRRMKMPTNQSKLGSQAATFAHLFDMLKESSLIQLLYIYNIYYSI